jgi:hypothetical protein
MVLLGKIGIMLRGLNGNIFFGITHKNFIEAIEKRKVKIKHLQ